MRESKNRGRGGVGDCAEVIPVVAHSGEMELRNADRESFLCKDGTNVTRDARRSTRLGFSGELAGSAAPYSSSESSTCLCSSVEGGATVLCVEEGGVEFDAHARETLSFNEEPGLRKFLFEEAYTSRRLDHEIYKGRITR